MYPFIRGAIASVRAVWAGPIGLLDVHENSVTCLPWDLDAWKELNNGRTLSLYDLGRVPLVQRTGLMRAARSEGLMFTVAGSTTRYRRRVTAMMRLRMTNRIMCWDDRFFYVEHAMWRSDGECTSHTQEPQSTRKWNVVLKLDSLRRPVAPIGILALQTDRAVEM